MGKSLRTPNATTVKAMQSADKKQGKRFRSTEALFKDLGIRECATKIKGKSKARGPSPSASSGSG